MDKIFKIKKKQDGGNLQWWLHIWGHPTQRNILKKWIKYLKLKKMAEIQDGSYTYGGIQHMGVSKHEGHPNVWGAYGHSLSVTKHAFFALCMYGASKHTGGVQTSKHVGIQTYRGCPNIQTCGHPNIQGCIQKHGSIQT